MKNLIKNDIFMARRFNNTMRYIDDLLILNNIQFNDAIQDIYPSELQLKKTTENLTTLSYLDILITTLYDKRDSFHFDIVNFPNMSSNIPSKPAYGVYVSQLLRIGRICSGYEQFCERHYKLTQKLIKQGFRYAELCKAFRRFAKSHLHCKYNRSVRRHIEDGVCLPASDGFLSRHVSTRGRSCGIGGHRDVLYTIVVRHKLHFDYCIIYYVDYCIIYYVHYFIFLIFLPSMFVCIFTLHVLS